MVLAKTSQSNTDSRKSTVPEECLDLFVLAREIGKMFGIYYSRRANGSITKTE